MSSEPAAKKPKMFPAQMYNNAPSGRKQQWKKQYMEAGQRGFLATCNFREKDCVRECYNILNQYADELYGPQDKDDDKEAGSKTPESHEQGDISDSLRNEVKVSNKQTSGKGRFQMVDTGTTNCIFIRTTLDDPVALGTAIVKDIAETREQKTRYLLRLLPVEAVCRANVPDILKAAGQLFDKHFLKQSSTYAIVFNKRYNNSIHRDDVIHELAVLVRDKNVENRVDLKQAAKTVVVEVIKGLCCLTVVEGYLQYRKYNLVELATPKEKETKEADKMNDKNDNDSDEKDGNKKNEANAKDKEKSEGNKVGETEKADKKNDETAESKLQEQEVKDIASQGDTAAEEDKPA